MRNKHFYISIITRLAIIIILVMAGTYVFLVHHSYILSFIIFLFLIIAVVNLIKYFNNINRWISFFLLGIENEDTTLKVPQKTGNKAIDEVFKGMDRLNELFKQAKIDISTQEQYFRMVINQSATGLFSVNENGRVMNINPAAEKLTKLNDYHHVNSLSNIDKSLPEFIMKQASRQKPDSAIFENKYGQKILFKLSEIRTKKEVIRLIAVSDITKELDNGEVDAWIKLARTLSHEIMNNIAPITTLSQVISKYYTQNNKVINADDIDKKTITNTVKGLKVIEERSLGLMNFVNNYRKFTKLPVPEMASTNISSLIENNLLAAETFPGFNSIQLIKHIPHNCLMMTDENLLSQVITNLLKNAYEALIQSETEKPVLQIHLREIGDQIRIEFRNNGPVIPPEIREQIFIPFYTTKEDGSGIGLSLSKQIMLSLGGDIILKSRDSSPVIFELILNS